MMNYDIFPFFNESNALLNGMPEDITENMKRLEFSFGLEEIATILQGEYHNEGSSSTLINIMGKKEIAGDLFYTQIFSIAELGPGSYTRREKTDSYELRYVLEGSGTLEYRGKRYHLKKGDGFFISSYEPHYYYAGKNGWKSTIFHINGSLCRQYFEDYASGGSVKFSDKVLPSFEFLQYQVLRETQKTTPYKKYRISSAIDLLLTELLAATAGVNSKTSTGASSADGYDIIPSVISYLKEHYDQKIVFDDLAEQFGISRSFLFLHFKQYTGYSPTNYLTELRINKAKLLLVTTRLSIEEIATETGFFDAAYFSQVFKRYAGITPLRYRNGMK